MRELPLWTPLAAIALALSWLLPNAYPPWLAFHKDLWLAAVVCTVACVWQYRERAQATSFRLDPLSALLLAMVLMSAWQWHAGTVHFVGHFAVGLLYLGGAALTIMLGRDWALRDTRQLGDFIFLALILAAFASSFAMLAQWLQQWQWMGNWIQEVGPASQPYANLNQPNNAATLMVLGTISVGWWAYRGKINLGIWWGACAFLSFFIAITGSRIGYITFVTSVVVTLVVGRRCALLSNRWQKALLLLLITFVAWTALVHSGLGGSSFGAVQAPRAFERDLTSIRLTLWEAYSHAALTRPWTGFGFEQGFLTQFSAAELGYRLNGLYTWSHNVLLDVATWFGLPIAAAVIGLLVWVLWRVPRISSGDPSRWFFLLAIYVVVLHGMVELPLAFAYFLIPVCLMTGAVLPGLGLPSVPVPRKVVATCTVALSALLAALAYDYFRIESAFYTWRFAAAKIGKNHPMDVPSTLVLDQFEALLTGLRGDAETLTERQVDDFEKAVVHDPSAAALQHLAEIRFRQGNTNGAQRAADMATLTAKPKLREALAARWDFLARKSPEMKTIHWGR